MFDGQLASHLPYLLTSDLYQNQTICCKCRPIFNNRVTKFKERSQHPDTPDLDEVPATRVPLRTHIPQAAQEGPGCCLLAANSGVISNTRGLTNLLSLPKLVLHRELRRANRTANAPRTT